MVDPHGAVTGLRVLAVGKWASARGLLIALLN